jgi:plastocyanin
MTKPKDLGALVTTWTARRTVLRVALAIALAAAGAIPALADGAEAKVTIDNFTFAPAEITVSVGSTVTWENRDDIPHTVVEKNKLFRSKALDTGDSYSFTFALAGTYDYFCGLHPHMVGKIIVRP